LSEGWVTAYIFKETLTQKNTHVFFLSYSEDNNILHHKITHDKRVVRMNDVSLLAIEFKIDTWRNVTTTCFVLCYGSFSYVVKLRNLTPFLLKLTIERYSYVSNNCKISIHIYFIAVFVKKVIAQCALSKAYQVLTQVNSNLTMTTKL